MEKENKYEIFSPILVVIQMRSVCTAVKKNVALMWGGDCLLTLDRERTGLVERCLVGAAWGTGWIVCLRPSSKQVGTSNWLISIMDDTSILRRRGLQVSTRKPFYWSSFLLVSFENVLNRLLQFHLIHWGMVECLFIPSCIVVIREIV